MNPKKAKEKERRRARKLADQAWEAADNDNLDLAEKIIRRAVATQPENPVLWNDQGMLLCKKGRAVEAEEAFRTAISLAPTYAEPYAQLAAIRINQGCVEDAIRLMEKAVKHAPAMVAHTERLEAYRALVVRPTAIDETQAPEAVAARPALLTSGIGDPALAQQLVALAWQNLDQRLTRDGCVLIPGLLDAATCAELRSYFDDDARFAKTVVMDRLQPVKHGVNRITSGTRLVLGVPFHEYR